MLRIVGTWLVLAIKSQAHCQTQTPSIIPLAVWFRGDTEPYSGPSWPSSNPDYPVAPSLPVPEASWGSLWLWKPPNEPINQSQWWWSCPLPSLRPSPYANNVYLLLAEA